MSENKFIKRLKGEQTAKSVLEIKNESAKTSFANMPQGTSNAINVYSDNRGNATAVLEGTDIWKLNNSQFASVPDALGDGRDFTSTYTVAGSTLWVNATYTFDQPKIFTGATQWTLKLCGHSLLSSLSNTIGFSLIIKFGNAVTITKSFSVSESAFEFCKEFIIDFSESEQSAIKVANGDTMTVQLLCADATASATIYNGMTTLVAQQRRVDGEAVASDLHTFEDLEVEVAQLREDLDDLEEYVDNTFLPLAGGTMTGDISFQYNTNDPVLRIIQSGQNTNHLRFINNNSASQSLSMDLSQAAIHPLVTGRGHVGTSNIHFGDAYIDKIYTGFINNGYDISVPVTASADSFALESEITDINGKIPAQASTSNQLADKSFVNSSIATNTANFIGTFNSVAELEAYSGTVTNNDYAFVIGTDLAGNTTYNRYKYNANTQQWIYEYTLNNSSFTAAQWASINSGVTTGDVTLARSSLQPGDVGNGTITLTQGGTTKGTFTTNQSGNTTIDLDAGGAGSYHPDLFDWKWADSLRNDVQWLRADTFSWQSGSVYQAAYKHLRNDMYNWYSWTNNGTTIYTKKAYPEVGEKAYSDSALTTEVGEITAVTDTLDITVEKITVNSVVYDSVTGSNIAPTTETVAGVTVQYIPAEDGHKIVTDFHESEVADVYTATGEAWYYIIDYGFKRFKLPRTKPLNGAIVGDGTPLGFDYNGNKAIINAHNENLGTQTGWVRAIVSGSYTSVGDLAVSTDSTKSGIIAERDNTAQHKYLYFYVGGFTQTAIENTAGLNAELFNGKADLNLANVLSNIDFVIESQLPTAENGYTWYRKYKSGWVEQGGYIPDTTNAFVTVTLPIEMANAYYSADVSGLYQSDANFSAKCFTCTERTVISFKFFATNVTSGGTGNTWEVKGMAA